MAQDTKVTGEIIKEKRLDKKLSQREFASLLNVSPAAVSKWENGKNLPDSAKLAKISSVLECTVDELLAGTGCPPANEQEPPEEAEPDASSMVPEKDIDETPAADAALPQPPPAVPAPPSGLCARLRRKPVIFLAVFIFLAAFCFIAVSYHTVPRYKVVDSFYGDDSVIRQMHDNTYYVIVEYHGAVQDEDILSHSSNLKDNYLDSCREDTALLIILYFQNYNPEQDYEDTADFVYTYYLKSPAEAQ